jgi:hypothetical protein
VARVDADVQRQRGLVRQFLTHQREVTVHLERDEQGTRRVVLVGDRRAEECEQRITGELLDVTLVAADDAAQAADDGVNYLEKLLGVEPIGERREPGDVGEQGGDQPALFRQLSAALDEPIGDRPGDEAPECARDVGFARGGLGCRRWVRRRAAMAAKTHPLGVFAAAGTARPRGHLDVSLRRA